MDEGGVILGYGLMALVGVIGLFIGRALGASSSDGFGVVEGDTALTCNIAYIVIALVGAGALTLINGG